MKVLCITGIFVSEGCSVPEFGPDAGIFPFTPLSATGVLGLRWMLEGQVSWEKEGG